MKTLHKLLLIFFLCASSTPLYSGASAALITGAIVDSALESADTLIRTAFDRLDLSLLQAGMEARSTIKEAEFSLKDVIDHSVDRLDEQQRSLVVQLQNFERLVAQDAEKALKEIREEKNSVFSDIRLLISDYPGAIRIIPKYAMEGEKYIKFKILGTALSKAKFKNMKFNSRPKQFSIDSQTDTQIIVRVPINVNVMSQLIARSGGKPAEVKINFEFVEYSWFKLFETDRRHFSAIAYIMPKSIGTAQAIFIGKVEKLIEKPKSIIGSSGTIESSRYAGIGGIGIKRKRGKAKINVSLTTDRGWKFHTETAKFKLKYLKGGCNEKRSSATLFSESQHKISVGGRAVTHLGHRSVCEIKVTLSAIQWKTILEETEHSPPKQTISTNKEIKFKLSPNNLRALKGATLESVKVISPLFENGTRYLKPGEELGGLKLEYNPQSRAAFLRFRYL